MSMNLRDLAAGAAFIVIGLAFGVNAWLDLRIGQANAMGPGYFPVMLGLILVGLGAAIAYSAMGQASEAFGYVSWRGVGLITLAIVFFALTVRGLGMAPALIGATLMGGLASGRLSLRGALALAVGLSAFCVAVFIYAMRLPFPVIGPWLRF
jgi:hypothetical protein